MASSPETGTAVPPAGFVANDTLVPSSTVVAPAYESVPVHAAFLPPTTVTRW